MTKSILLIDDYDSFREATKSVIETEDIEVVDVSGGDEALKKLNERSFDLVVTDIVMPDMEGLELAQSIKNLNADQKILGMSGGGRSLTVNSVEKLCRGLKFDGFIRKPFDSDEFIKLINELI